MRSSFDNIAPYYDALASLVYGKKLYEAKKTFLEYLPENGRLLLIGGGTGVMLNDILNNHKGLNIDFIEASLKMLELAKKKIEPGLMNRVNFIHGTHLQIPLEHKYDAATSFFVMDCMKQEVAFEFASAITESLRNDGYFLFADFYNPKSIYQRSLLWLMYRFFRITTGIQASELPDYEVIFQQLKLKQVARKDFMNGFIRTCVYSISS